MQNIGIKIPIIQNIHATATMRFSSLLMVVLICSGDGSCIIFFFCNFNLLQ